MARADGRAAEGLLRPVGSTHGLGKVIKLGSAVASSSVCVVDGVGELLGRRPVMAVTRGLAMARLGGSRHHPASSNP